MLIIAILAILLGMIILLVSIPIDFDFHFNSSLSPPINFRIGWFFSLVKLRIGKERKKKSKVKNGKKRKEKKKKGGSKLQYLQLITKKLFLRVIHLLERIFHAFHFRRITADLTAGIGEPADTGMVYGIVSPLFLRLPLSFRQQITITPDFGDEPVLTGDARIIIRFWPVEIIFVVLRFVFSWPVLKTVKNVIAIKWKSRN